VSPAAERRRWMLPLWVVSGGVASAGLAAGCGETVVADRLGGDRRLSGQASRSQGLVVGRWRRGRCGSGRQRERAQAGQGGEEALGPRPARRQVQVAAPCGMGEAAGRGDEASADCLGHTRPWTPSPSAATQRSRLWARVASSAQAALARNTPDGQWQSPAPCLRSRMASSTTAWRRWSASNTTALPVRSVTKAWWRPSGHSVAWAPTRRVRRTTSRPPALPARVVSATWAAPLSG
jgi:hypothetical protein